jgi:Arc/MetJ-type ribon-helix-helix transcriptional regulator
LLTRLEQLIRKEGNKTRLITLHLPEPYIKALDKLVDEKYYPNRAEAIRVAIRDLLNVEAWGQRRSNA